MIGALIIKRKVSSAFEALNRRDMSGFLSAWKDDALFVYHGNISASGEMEGRAAIENWFQRFLDQFPMVKFTLRNISVQSIFDFIGTNVVAAHWDVELTNRDGKEIQNSGVTIINIKRGKAFLVKDYLFNTGQEFREAWGEA